MHPGVFSLCGTGCNVMPCFEDKPIAHVELAPLSQRVRHHRFYPVLTLQPSGTCPEGACPFSVKNKLGSSLTEPQRAVLVRAVRACFVCVTRCVLRVLRCVMCVRALAWQQRSSRQTKSASRVLHHHLSSLLQSSVTRRSTSIRHKFPEKKLSRVPLHSKRNRALTFKNFCYTSTRHTF